MTMFDCYQCWVKNVRLLNGGRSHILLYQSSQDVIRDSYFYQAQAHYSQSYTIEPSPLRASLLKTTFFSRLRPRLSIARLRVQSWVTTSL